MKKGNIPLYAIYLTGVISLLVFIVTKNENLMNAATEGMYDHGDLYRFAKVLPFKTELPAEQADENDLRDADADSVSVITIGDSFFESSRGYKPFPVALSRKLGEAVYPVYAGYAPEYFDPVYFCWSYGMEPGKKKIIILERVERYIISTFGRERDGSLASFHRLAKERQGTWWDTIRRRWFTDAKKNYEVLLTSSKYTTPLIEFWNTLRFSGLRLISAETPVYSVAPPFLFTKEEATPGMITSFYYPHPDSLIEQIADNIEELKQDLRTEYNAELVFMPVPNAYTLYHKFINTDQYDEFLPRLSRMLEERGVRTIRVYEKFKESKSVLYFSTDTHWNRAGMEIALDETFRILRKGPID